MQIRTGSRMRRNKKRALISNKAEREQKTGMQMKSPKTKKRKKKKKKYQLKQQNKQNKKGKVQINSNF